ncbi:hypothetical protein [Actinacidiphila acididurans]|uniref:DUF1453 domain-containing protein n=1 Tax=Actinacidiphila acididurans TaxID=2784346 RepID=A0ABS2TZC1_9ACTN|nr:hypothetical protein [Actinacidiphila acididurans]MBM9508686.1 hypothetical protein [Actinacidiphila acididurans]
MLDALAVIAIAAYVIGRQLFGEALRGKRVILLPAVLAVIGVTRLGGPGRPVEPKDVALLLVSGLIAAAIGLGQGAMMRLSSRDGGLWGRMPLRGLWLWAALVGSRVVVMVLASALGAHVAASSAPILLMLGVNRLGQAAMIVRRAHLAGIPFTREKDGSVFLADRLRTLNAQLDGRSDERTGGPRPGTGHPHDGTGVRPQPGGARRPYDDGHFPRDTSPYDPRSARRVRRSARGRRR